MSVGFAIYIYIYIYIFICSQTLWSRVFGCHSLPHARLPKKAERLTKNKFLGNLYLCLNTAPFPSILAECMFIKLQLKSLIYVSLNMSMVIVRLKKLYFEVRSVDRMRFFNLKVRWLGCSTLRRSQLIWNFFSFIHKPTINTFRVTVPFSVSFFLSSLFPARSFPPPVFSPLGLFHRKCFHRKFLKK